jgi:hypothetical protein
MEATLQGLSAVVPGDCYDLVFFGSNRAGNIALLQFVSPGQWQSTMFYRESGYRRLGLRHEHPAIFQSGIGR